MTARNSAYRDHPLRAYTVEEAADILSCEPGWLEELAREGKVPYTELSGTCHFTSTHLAAISQPSRSSRQPVNPPRRPKHRRSRSWRTLPTRPPGSSEAAARLLAETAGPRPQDSLHADRWRIPLHRRATSGDHPHLRGTRAPKRGTGAACLPCTVHPAAGSSGWRALAAGQGAAQATESVSRWAASPPKASTRSASRAREG